METYLHPFNSNIPFNGDVTVFSAQVLSYSKNTLSVGYMIASHTEGVKEHAVLKIDGASDDEKGCLSLAKRLMNIWLEANKAHGRKMVSIVWENIAKTLSLFFTGFKGEPFATQKNGPLFIDINSLIKFIPIDTTSLKREGTIEGKSYPPELVKCYLASFLFFRLMESAGKLKPSIDREFVHSGAMFPKKLVIVSFDAETPSFYDSRHYAVAIAYQSVFDDSVKGTSAYHCDMPTDDVPAEGLEFHRKEVKIPKTSEELLTIDAVKSSIMKDIKLLNKTYPMMLLLSRPYPVEHSFFVLGQRKKYRYNWIDAGSLRMVIDPTTSDILDAHNPLADAERPLAAVINHLRNHRDELVLF